MSEDDFFEGAEDNPYIEPEPRRRFPSPRMFKPRRPEEPTLEPRRTDAQVNPSPFNDYSVSHAEFQTAAAALRSMLGDMQAFHDHIAIPTFYLNAPPTFDRIQNRVILELPIKRREDRWATIHALKAVLERCDVTHLVPASVHIPVTREPRESKRQVQAEGRLKAHAILTARSENQQRFKGKGKLVEQGINLASSLALATDVDSGQVNEKVAFRLMGVFNNHGLAASLLTDGFSGAKRYLRTALEAKIFGGYPNARRFFMRIDMLVILFDALFRDQFVNVEGDPIYRPLKEGALDTDEPLHLCVRPNREDLKGNQPLAKQALEKPVHLPFPKHYQPEHWQSLISESEKGLRIDLFALCIELRQAVARTMSPESGLNRLKRIAEDIAAYRQDQAFALAAHQAPDFPRRLVANAADDAPLFLSQGIARFRHMADALPLVVSDAQTVADHACRAWTHHDGTPPATRVKQGKNHGFRFSQPDAQGVARLETGEGLSIALHPRGALVHVAISFHHALVFAPIPCAGPPSILTRDRIAALGLDAKAYPDVIALPAQEGYQYLAWKNGCLIRFLPPPAQAGRILPDTHAQITAFVKIAPGAIPRIDAGVAASLKQQAKPFQPSAAVDSETPGGHLTRLVEARYPRDPFSLAASPLR